MQHESIAPAVQPAPHVCALSAIIDLVAVANVEAVHGAVPPDRALDEPGKHFWKRRIEPARVDFRGNLDQNVTTAAWPVAARAIRMGRCNPMQDSSANQEIVDESIDDDESGADIEPAGPNPSSSDQQVRQRHPDDLVGNPIDVPERVDEGGSGCCNVGRFQMGFYLPVNPPNDVAIGNVPDEQEQAVRGLVQPAVAEAMPGQRAIGKGVRVGAGLEALVVPTIGKCPIPVELVAGRVRGEGTCDVRPGHVPMLIDVLIRDGVGNPLVANFPDQPIEDRSGVMGCDCGGEASCDGVISKVIDQCNLTSNPADLANNGSGMGHFLTTTATGQRGCHVRSAPPTAAGRRCRRRCTAGSSRSTDGRRAVAHPATTRPLYRQAGLPGSRTSFVPNATSTR